MGFVAGVLDELLGCTSSQGFSRKALHHPEHVPALMKHFKDHWQYEDIGLNVSPGDVFLCKPTKMSHMLIVGWQENTCWHCIPESGVCRASIKDFNPLRVYGPKSKITPCLT